MSKAVEEWTKELLAEGSARGEAKGEARGEKKGNLNSIFKFTEDGTLPLARAVNEAMSYGVKDEKDFRKKAKKFGYKIS